MVLTLPVDLLVHLLFVRELIAILNKNPRTAGVSELVLLRYNHQCSGGNTPLEEAGGRRRALHTAPEICWHRLLEPSWSSVFGRHSERASE